MISIIVRISISSKRVARWSDNMDQRTLMIISSIVSMIGTFLVGYYWQRGIAKSGDLLRAPRQKSTKLG